MTPEQIKEIFGISLTDTQVQQSMQRIKTLLQQSALSTSTANAVSLSQPAGIAVRARDEPCTSTTLNGDD